MRVVALSNERVQGIDPDIPWALSKLQAKGLVREFDVFSTPVRVSAVGYGAAASEAAEMVASIQPDVVIFFHSGSCLFREPELERLHRAAPDATWIYREGDPFSRWSLPYPRVAMDTLRRCQAAFLFCDGYLADTASRAGVKFVGYAPSWVNWERFPFTWSADAQHRYDVAFLGSNVRSRIRRVAGAESRSRLVKILQARYGDRLALFGGGWSGPGHRGSCSLNDAGSVYAQSRVAVGIDHRVGRYQFSNRLPIALSCGIPLAHERFAGSDLIIPEFGEQLFDTPADAVHVIDRLLEMDDGELAALSLAEREKAETSLSCDVVLEYMLLSTQRLRQGDDPLRYRNPWLGERVALA